MNQLNTGKLLPQAVELEAGVLGRALMDTAAADKVVETLFATSFYKPAHQLVFEAIKTLLTAGNPVELLSVTDELRRTGKLDEAGGPYAISQLTTNASSSTQIEYYCRIIEQKRILRDFIRLGIKTVQTAYDESTDPFEVHSALETGIEAVMTFGGGQSKSIVDIMIEVKQKADKGASEEGITGIPTGISALDHIYGGRQNGHLILCGGRPGMGKTGKMVSEVLAAAKQGHHVAVFSLEMTADELGVRMAAQVAEIDTKRIDRGGMSDAEWQRFNSALGYIEKLPIHIFEDDHRNLSQILTKIRMLKRKHDIKAVYIDHVGWIKVPGHEGRTDERIGEISMSLKSCAKKLDIPIKLLLQLNRNVETRGGDKRPSLSDLKNSGNLEEDADVVEFIYRPEYYGITQYENGDSTAGVAEIIVAKHRGGSLETIRAAFIDYLTKFCDLDNTPQSRSDSMAPNKGFDDLEDAF